MSTLSILFLAVTLVPLLAVGGLIWFLMQRRGGVSAAAPAAAAPGHWYEKPLYLLLLGGAVVGILAFVRSSYGSAVAVGCAIVAVLTLLVVTGKGGVTAKVALGALGLMLFLFADRTPEVYEKVTKSTSGLILDEKPKEEEVSQGLQPPPQVQPQQQQLQLVPPRAVAVTESQSKWATGQASSGDAGIPVGVWSEEVKLKPGCRVTFASGSAHKVEYRYYSRKWLEYIPGTSPEMSGFRTMVTEEGVTEAPYTMTCF